MLIVRIFTLHHFFVDLHGRTISHSYAHADAIKLLQIIP